MKQTQSDNLLVELKNITKAFPGVLALDNVGFQLRPGEVHVLLGENGAGKSTLIKVLSGAYSCDSGDILIAGEKVHITTPQVPLQKGLRFIYQEISLVHEIDVGRNIFLGAEPTNALGLVDHKTLYARAQKLLDDLGIDIDPYHTVGDLSVGQQKMVEIAKALTADANVLVLDEPTDVLEDRSRNTLFELIHRLKTKFNVGFIYISHRYKEVYDLGDRVTILRDGKNAGTYNIDDITLDEMIEKMVGGQVAKQYPQLPEPSQSDALRIENVRSQTGVNGISLNVKQGEILGVTGLMGSGKTELARLIAGVDKLTSGQIFIQDSQVYCSNPAHGIANGIAYLTEDRKTEGLILDQSIRDNYALPNITRLSSAGIVNHRQIDAEAQDLMGQLKVKAPDRHTLTGQLSGGNQQKIVIAKWLGTDCKVLLFDEPTRGIDINGRAEVYKIMKDLLAKGVGIVMLTSDYTEALEMSHRIAVLRHGQVTKIFQRNQATEEDILRYAIGAE